MTACGEAERAYLESQRLGRLATVDPQGQPQANPVGFFTQDDGTILIGGHAMGQELIRDHPRRIHSWGLGES